VAPVANINEAAMITYLAGYIATLATFVGLDMAWLGTMTPRFYRPTLGDIIVPGVNLPPAIVFYALYPIGLLIFAINPALKTGSIASAIVYGALFGFFTYSTYDLTNYATLRNWSMQLTMIDIAWGCVLAAIASAAGFAVTFKLMGTG
jgi:uncharacterized membrane protein